MKLNLLKSIASLFALAIFTITGAYAAKGDAQINQILKKSLSVKVYIEGGSALESGSCPSLNGVVELLYPNGSFVSQLSGEYADFLALEQSGDFSESQIADLFGAWSQANQIASAVLGMAYDNECTANNNRCCKAGTHKDHCPEQYRYNCVLDGYNRCLGINGNHECRDDSH